MRLDARKGDTGWFVWDCRRAREVPYCVWVDDAAAQYGHWENEDHHRAAVLAGWPPSVAQVERIAIITTSRLVLIDPVDEEEKDLIEVAISRPMQLT
jgi:hypothetical protein